jgi:ribonuclease P protein component
MSTLNGYNKEQKLKSRKAMEALFASGKSFNAFPIKVFFTLEPIAEKNGSKKTAPENWVHAGVGVSSRNFKKAVDRNRVKRLLREVYRTQKQDLMNTAALQFSSLNVFFLYVGKELPAFIDLKISMEKTLEKLIVRITESAKQ